MSESMMSQSMNLRVGQRVRVSGGLLQGMHGVVAFFREQDVVVALTQPGAGIYAQFPASLVEPLVESS